MIRKLLFAIALTLAIVSVASGDVAISKATCATTAVLLYTSPPRGSEAIVVNTGTAAIFVGPAGVTTTTGFEVLADQQYRFKFSRREQLWCIVAAATEPAQAFELPK
jgi:hypothetical protein